MENFTKVAVAKKALNLTAVKVLLVLITLGFSTYMVNRFVFRSKASEDIVHISFSSDATNVNPGEKKEFLQIIKLNADNNKEISGIDLTLKFDGRFLKYGYPDRTAVPEAPNYDDSIKPILPPNALDYFEYKLMAVENGDNDKLLRIIMVTHKRDEQLLGDIAISIPFYVVHGPGKSEISLVKEQSKVVGTTGDTQSMDHYFQIDATSATNIIGIDDFVCTTDSQCGNNASCSPSSKCQCNLGTFNCDNVWTNGCESNIACPKGVTMNVAIKFQGINSTPSRAKTLKVLVDVNRGEQDGQLVDFTASDQNNGVFNGVVEMPKITPSRNFQIFIEGPMHIQERFCNTKPTGGIGYHCGKNDALSLVAGVNTLDLSAVPLLAGDLPLPQDGVLNSKDITAIKECIKAPTKECIEKTDVNYDGATNGTDFSIVLSSMAIKYDDEGTSLPGKTLPPEPPITSSVEPGVTEIITQCRWCGLRCVSTSSFAELACSDIEPPENKECYYNQNEQLCMARTIDAEPTNISEPTRTPTASCVTRGGSCGVNQRCCSNLFCNRGTCQRETDRDDFR